MAANQIDLGNGARDFPSSKVSVDTTPISADSMTDRDRKGRKTTETQFVGGNTTVTRCLYTFITAQRSDSWIVTGDRHLTASLAALIKRLAALKNFRSLSQNRDAPDSCTVQNLGVNKLSLLLASRRPGRSDHTPPAHGRFLFLFTAQVWTDSITKVAA